MKHNTLTTLLTIRQREVKEAQTALAVMIRQAEDAAERVRTAEARLLNERELALCANSDDTLVEAYAHWLPLGQRALEEARRAERASMTDLAQARSALALARAAQESVGRVLQTYAQEE